MTLLVQYRSMSRIIMVAFDGAQTLDLSGPAEVFATVGRLPSPGTPRPAYEVVVGSRAGAPIFTSAGFIVATQRLADLTLRMSDTVLVVGGDEDAIRAALADRELLNWVTRAASGVRRIGSVCSGAFVLAAAGVLDGRRAATHWSACARLAKYRPAVVVDSQAIFVADGRVWTSAGVTTGIDMALAMVESDIGLAAAEQVAAQLVLYVRRPGFQSQFSGALTSQESDGETLGAAIRWARGHLRDLDVERFARRCGLSVRTLARRCEREVGTTPAKLIERLRVEYARSILCKSAPPAKRLALEAGFGSVARMRRAFARELGVSPRAYRLMFGSQASR